MTDKQRIAQLESHVERLETAVVVLAESLYGEDVRYYKRAGSLAGIFKRVGRRSRGERTRP